MFSDLAASEREQLLALLQRVAAGQRSRMRSV
jgi:hypothetical protein